MKIPFSGIIIIWCSVMSFACFMAMGIDKLKARAKKWRLPERTLFLLAALGGALGLALVGVAVAAVVIAGLISLVGKLEDLEKKLDALTAAGAAPEGESTPPEADDGEAPGDSAEH